MAVTKTTMAIVAAACVTAGAAGGFLLSRDASPPPDAVSSESAVSPDPALASVEQSEAVIGEAQEPALEDVRPEPVRPPARPATPRPVPPPRPVAAVETPAPVTPPAPTEVVAVAPAPIEPAPLPVANEPAAIAPAPIEPEVEELVVAGDAVIGLQLETEVTTETAQVEDRVVARVTRDVKVGDRVAIPAGSKAHGEVTLAERGGKLRERARLGVRFTSIVLADGTRLPIEAEPIFREGDAPGRESAAKIGGGAIGGAILGGILGGAKGAAIGGAIGGGAGSAAVLAGGRNPATLSPGEPVTIRLKEPVTVVVPR